VRNEFLFYSEDTVCQVVYAKVFSLKKMMGLIG
jgi:hypothetical protein